MNWNFKTASKDHTVYVPSTEPGAYATINKRWRYIHYSDGTEELYDQSADPNEWNNLVQQAEYNDVIARMKQAAPTTFSAPATPNTELQLVLENEDFYWMPKRP